MALSNTRWERFCQAYALCVNATEAAKSAGYSSATAAQQGSRLLRNVEISQRIEEIVSELSASQAADAAEVLLYLSETMRNEDLEDSVRLRAAELLGRRHGLFRPTALASASVPVVIVDDV